MDVISVGEAGTAVGLSKAGLFLREAIARDRGGGRQLPRDAPRRSKRGRLARPHRDILRAGRARPAFPQRAFQQSNINVGVQLVAQAFQTAGQIELGAAVAQPRKKMHLTAAIHHGGPKRMLPLDIQVF